MGNKKSNKIVKNNVELNVDIKDAFKKLENKNKISSIESKKAKTVDEITRKWDMNDKIIELFREKIKNDNNLKSKYAIVLMGILIVQLLLLNLWFFLKGREILIFSDKTFNIFITGGIAEIFVLVRLIIKYLFNDNLSQPLNTISENNNIKNYNKKNNNKKNNNIKDTKEQE